MPMIRNVLYVLLVLAFGVFQRNAVAEFMPSYDIVIYGATSAGVAAAVQAKRMGKSVIIVGPDRHLGGLSSSGLGYTDSGNKAAVGGVSREFYERVSNHYRDDANWKWEPRRQIGSQGPEDRDPAKKPTMWVFEPHVAEKIFEDLVHEYDIPVVREEYLDRDSGVETIDGHIRVLSMLSGKKFSGKVFIDATYEGDLLAAAGVSYHVGREGNEVYRETLNGVQTTGRWHGHHFRTEISPYLIPGDPASGLLPRISADAPGEPGTGDHRIQAYCYRLCLTDHLENQLPFPKPEGYDASQYQLFVRVLESGWRDMLNKFDRIPNGKTDTNNHGPFSTDNIGFNYDYPEATYARRQEILAEHIRYQQGLMYFMVNDPQVPEDVREAMGRWGLAKDEFPETAGWPHQIYVRESRRMIGEYVMTEHDCQDTVETPESIGMGSYNMDSHNTQRYVTAEGFVQNEGDVQEGTPGPYEIALGAIRPRQQECKNLLVPVCVSSSHIAYGSIRMEPVFMVLGQSAATVAALAIDAESSVQAVPYETLRKQLLKDRQVLELVDPDQEKLRQLPGLIIDEKRADKTGHWTPSTASKPFWGSCYLHDGNSAKGEATATFDVELPAGRYEVRISTVPLSNRASNVPVTIQRGEQKTVRILNQQTPLPAGEFDVSVGVFDFSGTGSVMISNAGTDGYVIVDSVRFVPVDRQ